MAQWLGQFSGLTHASAVDDAERLLRHAASTFGSESESVARRKKAKNARSLAKRVLRARIRYLKAALSDQQTQRDDGADPRHDLSRLLSALEETEDGGLAAILVEFGAPEVLALLEPSR